MLRPGLRTRTRLDELVYDVGNLKDAYSLRNTTAAVLFAATSDEFAAAVRSHIDETPLRAIGHASIAWETEEDRQAARDEVANAKSGLRREAEHVRELIRKREEEERRQALEEERQLAASRREERRRRDDEEVRRLLQGRGEQLRQQDEQRRLLRGRKS